MRLGDNMNNKGFTLVEVLATIVILGIVMGIAAYGVLNAIDKSKEKSEKLFVGKLETVIQSYITNNRLSWRTGDPLGTFIKCRRFKNDGTCFSDDEAKSVDYYKVGSPLAGSSFNLDLLANDKYIQGGVIINPKNKKNCLSNGKNPSVVLYKDDDSVYYYYVDLRGSKTSCDIDDDIAIISNIPKNMCDTLSDHSWNSDKEVCE